jgi:2-polyprenyl-3-methyl-5-hydroxy-6-metoxy-1,4-benzoquinol methylase
MNDQEITEHIYKYYNPSDRAVWEQRKLLNIRGILVPEYIYHGHVDPNDHSTAIYDTVVKHESYFRGKKFLDIGTCAGINNILLAKDGYDVTGLDNTIYSLNCSIYVMEINQVYYKLMMGDHTDIEKIDHDVLIINQMGYIPGFMDTMKPIIEREQDMGRLVMVAETRFKVES